MEIKICGITEKREAYWLNEAGCNYAGFVFFEKSKRNVSIEKAKEIMAELDEYIRPVAVTVSPDVDSLRAITEAGFSIIQIHGELKTEVIRESKLPIWYAINIAKSDELASKSAFLAELPSYLSDKIEAIVVDGAEYGSGKTFDWQKSKRLKKAGAQSPPTLFSNRSFVLAGGLNPDNVCEGINIFSPDIVDVSSGVEDKKTGIGKDRDLIFEFIRKVRESSNEK